MPTEFELLKHPPPMTTIPELHCTPHPPAVALQVACLIVTASASTESEHTAKDAITKILILKANPPSAAACIGGTRCRSAPAQSQLLSSKPEWTKATCTALVVMTSARPAESSTTTTRTSEPYEFLTIICNGDIVKL